MEIPVLSIIDGELMDKCDEAEFRADSYMRKHWDKMMSLPPTERQKKLAEVMFGVTD